jgi:hypothetical protein
MPFLVTDDLDARKKRIMGFLEEKEPVIAILLAAADFERTVRRAIRGLSEIQPSEVKKKIERDYGSFKKYPDAWKKYAIGHKELFIKTTKRTPSYSDSDVILTLAPSTARRRGFPRKRASQRRMFEGDASCKESHIIIPRYQPPTSAMGTLCSR